MSSIAVRSAPVIIKSARELERLSIDCTTGFVPRGQAVLEVLTRFHTQLIKKGWEVSIANANTNTVCWIFRKKASKRTVCRHVHITPIAHYPIAG